MAIWALATVAMSAPSAGELARWGDEALCWMETGLTDPRSGLYADGRSRTDGRSGPAFCWGVGVALSALNAAAIVDPAWSARLRVYVDAIEVYWNRTGPVAGYDVLPCPKPVDRYYDDNAWLVLGLVEASGRLDDPALLDRARATMAYVLSGEDERLGGGIYWRESDRASKNACSNAPSAAAALALYRATGERPWLEAGSRILNWTFAHLADPEDGLLWDNINLDGRIERTKWSYNSALAIRALLLRAETAEDPADAQRDRERAIAMARASVARWIDPETGGIRDPACFAHLLVEALLEVPDEESHAAALRALGALHERGRDAEGWYPDRWDTHVTEPLAQRKLIDQASAARAFLHAASRLSAPSD